MTDVSVPCGGCVECCRNSVIPLHPTDDSTRYDCYLTHFQGKDRLVLRQRENGDCVYLGENGCTIHDRAPLACRLFDCRRLYEQHDRAGRRRLVREGKVSRATFDRARELLGAD